VFFDHTHRDCGGDAISIVMLALNLSFREALLRINDDFQLGLKTHSSNSLITPPRVKIRKLSKLEILEKQIDNFKKVHYKVVPRL
jgi:hypothetical protein